jgi:hypothetical protein
VLCVFSFSNPVRRIRIKITLEYEHGHSAYTTIVCDDSARRQKRMEQTLDTSPVLLHSHDFESQRMLSVLKRRALVVPEQRHSELATATGVSALRLQHVLPTNSLCLISCTNRYQGFWNILLVLDKLYWGSALILSDPQILETTFALVEHCEQRLFPHLEHQDRNSHRSHSKRSLSNLTAHAPLTHLLQWIASTEPQRALRSNAAKRQYRGIEAQSLRNIQLGLQEVRQEAELLPEVHRDIVQGNIDGAIQYAMKLNPHMKSLDLRSALSSHHTDNTQ